jgi:hypothetical protein
MFIYLLHPFVRKGIAWLLSLLLLASSAVAEYPTNGDPSHQIRFHTPAQADAKRQQLINYIWPGGLPTSTLPAVTTNISFPSTLTGITSSLVSSIDVLDANVSGMDFHSISYLIHPKNTANVDRLAIVHQGHSSSSTSLDYGIGATANRLLQDGYSVITVQMPLNGWNTDHTVVVPGGTTVAIAGSGSGGHTEMFDRLGPVLGGGAVFRFFLEPVVQAINYFKQVTPGLKDINMIGLSGGGWTTHMAAAIDTRIKLIEACSGSAPLYEINKGIKAGTWHDAPDQEQCYTPMFDERINADGSGGGIATWLEIYALGGYGDGRRQIMTNVEGDQYFNGHFADSFKNIVSDVVQHELQKGKWEHVLDTATSLHSISAWNLNDVFMPALAVPEPNSCVLVTMGLLGVMGYACRKLW